MRIQRTPASGWSVEDMQNATVGKNSTSKIKQLFKGITPTFDEFKFVIHEMAKIGVLNVKPYVCDTTVNEQLTGMKPLLELYGTTYTFNHKFSTTDNDDECEPTSSKRPRQE